MKTIGNYIKEAFITKSNIAGARKANNANLQFPDVDFEEGSDEDAKTISDWLYDNKLMPGVLYDSPGNPNGYWAVELGFGRIVHYLIRYKYTSIRFSNSVIDIGPDYVKRLQVRELYGTDINKRLDDLAETIKDARNIQ